MHYQKKLYNIWKALWKHSYLAFGFAGNGLAPTTNKYRYCNVALPCSVIGEKCNLQCPKFKINNRLCRNVWFFYILLPKISNSFQGIHHDIVNLWTIYEYSIIRCWHHSKYATSHRIILWALKKKPRSSHYGILTKICYIWINQVYIRFRTRFLLISVNIIYTNEADFR